MVVLTTQGNSNRKIFEIRDGTALGDLLRDYVRALELYSIDMESVRESLSSIFAYIFLLTVQIFGFLWVVSWTEGKKGISSAAGLSFGAFCVMTMFFFGAGYIYKEILKKRADSSYISYVYVVGLSVVHYPYLMFIGLLAKNIWMFLCMMAITSISQFLIRSSMLRNHNFESSRDGFMFDIASFILQCGFCFGSLSLFSFLSPGN
ncbi:uncharacterized protein Eint_071210 [Encephalitozoon intestinalis ATCC 50506]|uniref:Uncharacterized protein n=1 Tax=Encephalitozoon intestinalis (strain ATCC 50506) TaxID=876142 RepID=E0S849_ENCIT|nr:uncharacterized protein Eint_071210 [Encephalitozoon intestinalis ATCC 50506]ADM11884.1 hypothetical protein Eint_071210 [Encephalitozoon intestinalis ATCC 50506]UTX45640.1 hypothetical protein GPK93_07g12050 [Encephalitozoon intestinalis]